MTRLFILVEYLLIVLLLQLVMAEHSKYKVMLVTIIILEVGMVLYIYKQKVATHHNIQFT